MAQELNFNKAQMGVKMSAGYLLTKTHFKSHRRDISLPLGLTLSTKRSEN